MKRAMPGRVRADAILIDLDGVIRFWPRPYDAAVEAGTRRLEDEVFVVAFAPALLHLAITGEITHGEWTTETVRRLAADWPVEEAERAVAVWSDSVATVDTVVRDLIAEWRRSVPVALVTNATSRLGQDLAAVGLDGHFDAVINSSEVGAAKPDPAIFEAALERLGVPADRAILIDDTLANVEAAGALGLTALHFDGDVDRLRTFVDARLP